jgi:integrase
MAFEFDTPAKRSKLPIAKKPVWARIAPGVFLGYRRSPEARKWLVRYGRPYVMSVFANADDPETAATGVETQTFTQATSSALKIAEAANVPVSRSAIPVTVRLAVEEYIAVRNARDAKIKGRDVRSDADTRLTKHVLSNTELSDTLLRKVTADTLRDFADGLALKPANKKRLCADLKAALRASWEKHRKALPTDWRDEVTLGLKTGEDVENSREIQVLSPEQMTTLMTTIKEVDRSEGWEGHLYRLFTALAATGMRFSQLARMTGSDARIQQRGAGSDCVLMVPASRKGRKKSATKPIKRIVAATDFEIIRPDKSIAANEPLLTRLQNVEIAPLVWQSGARVAWRSASEIDRVWKKIVKRAGIPRHTIPYALRHTSIVRQLKAGLPVTMVAALNDTSPAMISKHYAAFIVDASDDMIAAVTFGIAA